MPLLSDTTDNFVADFSSEFFNTDFIKFFSDYLYNANEPLKDFQSNFYSTIQSFSIPGFTVSPTQVSGMNNLRNVTKANMTEPTLSRQYVGNAPLDEIFNSKQINITFKSNNFNWLYCYMYFRDYYSRKRKVKEFRVCFTIKNSALIPNMNFIFSDCFINSLPDLEFNLSSAIKEPKTWDLGISFNKFDVQLLIPEFNSINIR